MHLQGAASAVMSTTATKQAAEAAEEEPKFDPTLDSWQINYARLMSHVTQVGSENAYHMSVCTLACRVAAHSRRLVTWRCSTPNTQLVVDLC